MQRIKAESAVMVVFSEIVIFLTFLFCHKQSIVALSITNENQSLIGQKVLKKPNVFSQVSIAKAMRIIAM